jgi:hypothetical protein
MAYVKYRMEVKDNFSNTMTHVEKENEKVWDDWDRKYRND